MLLDTEYTPRPSLSLLSPRLMGPFKVLSCPAPNTYLLDIPAVWRICPEFKVERISVARQFSAANFPARPLEHEVQELLKFKMRYGRPHVLVRWAGRDASGDTWEQLDNLTNCEEAISTSELATGCTLPRPPPAPPGRAAASSAPLAPVGFAVEAAPPGDLGAALVGRTILYWWPTDGWQRGTVAHLCPRGVFSHVVAYSRQSSALRGTADLLLDAASYGIRWVVLSPALPTSAVACRCPQRRAAPWSAAAPGPPP